MKNKSVEELLQLAEEIVEGNEDSKALLKALGAAEKKSQQSAAVLCKSAQLLYRFAIYTSSADFLFMALDKLKSAQACDPSFFENHLSWQQLWGNVLAQLGKLKGDKEFLEQAIERYTLGESKESAAEFFWDFGEAWIMLGCHSMELSDLTQGIIKFDIAQKKGLKSPFFSLSFGSAFLHLAQLKGDPSLVEEALFYFREVISLAGNLQQKESLVYRAAWKKLATAYIVRCKLTHTKSHFDEADALLQEAILATAHNCELWLDWAELYLHIGWLKRDFQLIETGIEKLTALKAKECDPVRCARLLGIGMVLLGLFMENLKLIKEGCEQIEIAEESSCTESELAAGFKELGLGIYFSDEGAFEKAVAMFTAVQQADSSAVDALHGLFQTYQVWGLHTSRRSLLQRSIHAISRLCEMRPYSALYFNEWGVALLSMAKLTEDKQRAHSYIEESLLRFAQSFELGESEWTLYNWGCAYDLLGDLTLNEQDFEKAIDLLSLACKLKPTDFQIRYHLALALSHLGELDSNTDYLAQAVEILALLVEIDPEDEQVLTAIGYALLNHSQLALDTLHLEEAECKKREAEKALLQAARLGHPEACYHLACLYSLAELYNASLQFLKKAQELGYVFCRDDLEQDEWLEGVRNTEEFQDFLLRQD